MNLALAEAVRHRASYKCEYCQLPQEFDDSTCQIDHIIATYHGGPTRSSNLCLACYRCNSFKGPNLAGIDPNSKRVIPLFHPRLQKWKRHFRWRGPRLIGRTPTGRATVAVLQINVPLRVTHRRGLIAEGVFPPA